MRYDKKRNVSYNQLEKILSQYHKYGYTAKEIYPNVYRITARGIVYMELFVGTKKALLLDTGYGVGDLASFVKELTNKPLIIVNTHGHVDHASANYQFEEPVYIHEDEWSVCEEQTGPVMRKQRMDMNLEQGIVPKGFDVERFLAAGTGTLLPLHEGDIFELGGITLRAILLPGHTHGSMAFMYEERKILYLGDAMNVNTWLIFPESTDVDTYINSIKKAMNLEFDRFFVSHKFHSYCKDVLSDFLYCAENYTMEHASIQHTFFGDAYSCRVKYSLRKQLKYIKDVKIVLK